jgi:hypothetical protein
MTGEIEKTRNLGFINERVTVKKLLPAEPCVRADYYTSVSFFNRKSSVIF